MKKHIFLVDDDKDEMLFFNEALRQLPFPTKCTWAQSGEQALQQLAYLSPDLIVLDCCMPGMNGLDCLQAIKRILCLKSIPVLFHSSTMSAELRLQALTFGATVCMAKSDSIPELTSVLSNILQRKVVETLTQVVGGN